LKRYLPFLIIGVVFVTAVTSGALLYRIKLHRLLAASASVKSELEAVTPHSRGSSVALVKVEEFGDFECPPCAQLCAALKNIQAEYGSDVDVTFREYPLQAHRHAFDAACVAEAAGLQGRFWEMHDLLYEKQSVWNRADDAWPLFEGFAHLLGLDAQRFKKDIASRQVRVHIAADQTRAALLGVDRTPTVFVNGTRAERQPITEANLRGMIKTELSKERE
jgi:protein-disulfide isomerase